MTRSVFGPVLVLVCIVSAAALSASRPARHTLNLPAIPYRYAYLELPAHLTQPGRSDDNTPADNRLSDHGATLGRVLFYDTRLSANDTTSCASCHVQAHAFADPNPSSKGFHGALTDRRAMPLVNLRYYPRARFFWDERAGNLEEMVLLPIQSRIEMGQDLNKVVATLARDAKYPVLFARAFGDKQITEQRIGKALAQFVRSLVSSGSRYDEGRSRAPSAQADFENFTLQENRGKALFMRNCGTCHMKAGNEHFFVPTPANTGLRGKVPTEDGGVGDFTLRPADLGSFKSPSLRNVEVTAPFGHDGRFATLDKLIDHYSDNAIFDPNLGYMMPVGPLKFTASEKAALIAFLNTLTDPTFLTDPRFSNPFVKTTDVRTKVTRTVRTTGAMLMEAAETAAQAPAVLRSALLEVELPPVHRPPIRSPIAVVDRILSFDLNTDRRITRDELPERMQELVARGDRNADAALDTDEIHALVNTTGSSGHVRRTFHFESEGLPGVVKDLKLPPAKHDAALAIVRAHKPFRHINDPAGRAVQSELKPLLDDEEYENFVAAAARLAGPRIIIK